MKIIRAWGIVEKRYYKTKIVNLAGNPEMAIFRTKKSANEFVGKPKFKVVKIIVKIK